jgi:hypothetical protein
MSSSVPDLNMSPPFPFYFTLGSNVRNQKDPQTQYPYGEATKSTYSVDFSRVQVQCFATQNRNNLSHIRQGPELPSEVPVRPSTTFFCLFPITITRHRSNTTARENDGFNRGDRPYEGVKIKSNSDNKPHKDFKITERSVNRPDDVIKKGPVNRRDYEINEDPVNGPYQDLIIIENHRVELCGSQILEKLKKYRDLSNPSDFLIKLFLTENEEGSFSHPSSRWSLNFKITRTAQRQSVSESEFNPLENYNFSTLKRSRNYNLRYLIEQSKQPNSGGVESPSGD